MTNYDKVYQKLKKMYTDEEIADSILIPKNHSEEENKRIQKEFGALRMKLRAERTPEEILLGKLLTIKYRIEDSITNQ